MPVHGEVCRIWAHAHLFQSRAKVKPVWTNPSFRPPLAPNNTPTAQPRSLQTTPALDPRGTAEDCLPVLASPAQVVPLPSKPLSPAVMATAEKTGTCGRTPGQH